MMPYTTIVRSWYYESYPQQSSQSEAYWVNKLAERHQLKMSQGREHAEAIVDVKRWYAQSRGRTWAV